MKTPKKIFRPIMFPNPKRLSLTVDAAYLDHLHKIVANLELTECRPVSLCEAIRRALEAMYPMKKAAQ